MRSLHAFGIIRYLLQRFVNSCILHIIFKGYPSFFGEILRKDFTLLHRGMKEVSNVSDVFFTLIWIWLWIDIRNLAKTCQVWFDQILAIHSTNIFLFVNRLVEQDADTLESMYTSRSTDALQHRSYQANILYDEKVIRADLIKNVHSWKY